MTKKLGIILSSLSCVNLQTAVAQTTKASQPNIIYILADDLGYGDLGCYGQQKISTPNIDSMAGAGMRFTQHYSGSTVSAPSRCSLLTGKHTGHAAIRGNINEKGSDGKFYDTSLPDAELTIAELLKTQNYATACIGKWGMGGIGSQGHPNKQGFDYFYGYLGQANAHWYYPEYIHENSQEIILGKKVYTHDLFENKAVEFIKLNANKPFFLYLAVTIPHAELQIPAQYRTTYENSFLPEKAHKGDYSPQEKPHATFAAMVSRMDATVGKINQLLRELKLDENTIVIFSSDNGPHKEGGADPLFFNSSGGLRGTKRDLYEGGIRVPMIVKWPQVVKAGTVSNQPSAFWDVMPTLAEAAHVKTTSKIDGVSFLPTLKGKNKGKKHKPFYWEFYEQGGKQAILSDDWKLIKLNVKTPDKAYFELYNIKDDLSEKNNLASTQSAMVKKLSKLLDKQYVLSEKFKW
jgi:arylsulfatase A-like enzyme